MFLLQNADYQYLLLPFCFLSPLGGSDMLYLLEAGGHSARVAESAFISHLGDGHVGGAQETACLVHATLQDQVAEAAAELRHHHAGKIRAIGAQCGDNGTDGAGSAR